MRSSTNNAHLLPILGLVCTSAYCVAKEPPRLTLHEVLAMSDAQLAALDIAAMNLACAEGLPGYEGVDPLRDAKLLDTWAERIAHEIRRHSYRFANNPGDYNHSWGEFSMLVAVTVLQKEFGFRYNDEQKLDMEKFDFTDTDSLFMKGLLDGTGGTCTSMPVAYVAIGRRLGLPLHLVMTADHYFVRYGDTGARDAFNMEGTCRGFRTEPDEYYRHWPRNWSTEEKAHGGYLINLTPRQCLAAFLTTRGDSWTALGNLENAVQSYRLALENCPNCYSASYWYPRTLAELQREGTGERDPAQLNPVSDKR